MSYKILLVGEAAREHAIADAICRSTWKIKFYAVMAHVNPGIKRLCKQFDGEVILGNFLDPKFVAEKAKQYGIDLVVVGPEEPLFRGVCDEVERVGIPCIGPCRAAAMIEQSKAFMRRLMWKYKIPGRLRFHTFKNIEDAIIYLKEYAESVAVKPARQVGGKGVKVLADLQAYLSSEKRHVKVQHAKEIFEKIMKGYDDIDDKILIEEKVEGPEYTLQCFTDGETVLPMPLVQDHKAAFEMSIGPETGGMGSIADKDYTLPFITKEEFDKSVEIVKATVDAIHRELDVRYRGIISGQMMLTTLWGPTIIEYYCRFGDPEALNVLTIMETDIVEIFEAIVSRKLSKIKLKFKPVATVVKCIAPEGYPNRKDLAKGHPVVINEEEIEKKGCKLYYASVHEDDGKIVTVGSRTVEIVGFGETISEASKRAEECVKYVKTLDNWRLFHRSDIGEEDMVKKMIDWAETIRRVYKYREEKGLIGKFIDWIPGIGKIVQEY